MSIFERLALRKKLVKAIKLAVDTAPKIYHVEPTRIIFAIPHGINPSVLHEKTYVFRQIFGENTELEGDLKRFILTIPNKPMPTKVPYKLDEWKFALDRYQVPIICGVDSLGNQIVFDMAERPHMLISGETGSGKSSLLRAIITSLITTQDSKRIRFILGDLKRSEFGLFRRLPHVESVSVDITSLEDVLENVETEMQHRGDLLDRAEVTHINALSEPLPYLIIAIDEVGLLRNEKRIMEIIENISSIGRSLGVLLMLSMQRPDAKVLDGRLKNNLTVRISGRQSNKINANVAGLPGAETIGQTQFGRMLIDLDGIKRVQTPWIDESQVKKTLEPLKIREVKKSTPKEEEASTESVVFGLLLGGKYND